MATKQKSVAQKIVDEIDKEQEFWSCSTKDSFVKFAKKLLTKGFTKEETKDFLDDVYNTVCGEFGN